MPQIITIQGFGSEQGKSVSGYVLPAKIEELKFPFTLKFAPNYKPIIRKKVSIENQQGSGTTVNFVTVTDARKVFKIVAVDSGYMVSSDGVYIAFVPNGGSESKRYMVYSPIEELVKPTNQVAGFNLQNNMLFYASWGAFAYMLYLNKREKNKYSNYLIALGLANAYWTFYRISKK